MSFLYCQKIGPLPWPTAGVEISPESGLNVFGYEVLDIYDPVPDSYVSSVSLCVAVAAGVQGLSQLAGSTSKYVGKYPAMALRDDGSLEVVGDEYVPDLAGDELVQRVVHQVGSVWTSTSRRTLDLDDVVSAAIGGAGVIEKIGYEIADDSAPPISPPFWTAFLGTAEQD